MRNDTPMYWPKTTDMLLKSSRAKNAIKMSVSSRFVAINAFTATSIVKMIVHE